jgi:hypothetical protein
MTIIPLNCLDTSCLGVVERTQIWPGAIDLWPDYNSQTLMASLPKQPNYLEMMVMPDSMSVTEQAIDVEWNPSSLRDTPLGPFFLLNFSRKRLRIELNGSCCAFSVRTISVIITEKRRSKYLSEMLNIFLKRKIDDEGRYTTDVWTENFELTCEGNNKYANASLHALSNYVFSLQEYGKAEALIPSDAESIIGRLLGNQRDPNIISSTDTSFDEIWTSCCEATPSRTTFLPIEWQVARAIWILEAVGSLAGLILEGTDPGKIYFPLSFDRTWFMVDWGADESELEVRIFTKRRITCEFSTFYEDVYNDAEALKVLACLGIEFVPDEDEEPPPPTDTYPPPHNSIITLEDGSWRLPAGSRFGFASRKDNYLTRDDDPEAAIQADSFGSMSTPYTAGDVHSEFIEISIDGIGNGPRIVFEGPVMTEVITSYDAGDSDRVKTEARGFVKDFINDGPNATIDRYNPGGYKRTKLYSNLYDGEASERTIVLRLPTGELYFMNRLYPPPAITWAQ